METVFTPWEALIGGVLIGLSAVMLMALNGRIAGMTGILAGLVPPFPKDWGWRAAFTFGALAAPAAYAALGGRLEFGVPVSTAAMIGGGLIVGAGAYVGSGCTSGHGVCGMARLSPRSIVATCVFMAATFVTVFVVRHVIGGV
ncbi:MAG: YeeE/YedE family protein [Rhodobiaceae bacterium]|nr:YeeE/YedE family protein [Rhodobiaceae bacterium]MCC0057343.1 YeeE/YedE family protein [Rhodobiaceae bacterium]